LRPTGKTRDSELAVAGVIGRKQTWSLECMVTLCLAGREAEREFYGHISDGSDRVDYAMARDYLAHHVSNPLHAAAELARFRAAAQRLVRSAWAQHRICLLADAFLRNGSLSGDEDIGSCVEPHLSRRIRVVHAPSMAACAVAQQEIFNDKLAVATRERSPTGTAGYVVEGGLWSSFDFDDLIQCLAVRAREGNKRRGPAASHLRPPIPNS
jgi:hypothetical protein